MSAVRILLADDHELVRQGERAMLESRPGWSVIGEARTGREAVEKCRQLKPDIAIVDLSMPDLNGLEATRQILKYSPGTEVMVLTMHESEQVVRRVLEAGARAYVAKSETARCLVDAVEAVAQHKAFFTSGAAAVILEGYVNAGRKGHRKARARTRLTPRETEVIQLLAEGRTSKEVASVLGISIHTAETHRSNIMCKLDLHSASDMVRYAIRNNITRA